MAEKCWKKSPYTIFDDAWVSEKYENKEIYVNDERDITSPNEGLYYVKISKHPKKWVKTKSEAIKYAKDYMKKHC